MKAVKELEHGLLLNYFGTGQKYYYVVSVLTFFGFDDPSLMLNEQEMWPLVQAELGPENYLDQGMPKPRGEVLVRGKYFSTSGKPAPMASVSFSVGQIVKSLALFGNRHWKKKGGLFWTMDDPEPFLEMDLTWENAFGGEGYPFNPIGLGATPLKHEWGETYLPLPNIEDPNQLIRSPDDRPRAAGILPYDLTWPQRTRKLGTFDDKWFRERWPYYPEDTDPTFFNAAPQDQQLKTYFKGDEALAFANMHPTKPLLASFLPGLKQRVFINQLEDWRKPKGESQFKEIKTNIDTVWLFPHVEKGIVITRGVTEVADDEARDVNFVFVATEALTEPPQTIEYYYQEFQEKLKNPIKVDLSQAVAAQEEADRLLAGAKETLLDLPQQIEDSIAQGLDQAPKPVRTPKEVVTESLEIVRRQSQQLDEAEIKFKNLKAEFGHMAKIDLKPLAVSRQSIDQAQNDLKGLSQKIDQIMAEVEDKKTRSLEKIKEAAAKVGPKTLENAGFDPDEFIKTLNFDPENPWHDRGMRFLEKCRDRLLGDSHLVQTFRSLGLRPYTLKRSWLGLNPETFQEKARLWGLDRPDDQPPDLTIPPGLVIPRFLGPTLYRLAVRPGQPLESPPQERTWTRTDQDQEVEGSVQQAMILSPAPGKPVVRVRTELEAILLNQEMKGLVTVAALEKPDDPLDPDSQAWAAESPQVLIITYPESDQEHDREAAPWAQVFPQAESLPLEAPDLFQARRDGKKLRPWIINALKPGLVTPDPEIDEQELDKPGGLALLIPKLDVPAMIEKIRTTLMARVQPELDAIEAKKGEAMELFSQTLKKIGQDPDKLLQIPPAPPASDPNPFKHMANEQAKYFKQIRQTMEQCRAMTPDVTRQMDEFEQSTKAMIQDSAKQYEEGLARLEQAKGQAGLPAWAKKTLAMAGLDPEDPEPLKSLTREEVIDRHQNGQSLAGKILNELDLSGLDLKGADLRQAQLQKTNLTGCNLTDADLTRVIASEADFSKAILKQARMKQGLFEKALFIEADLKAADLTEAIMSRADLTQANLSQAVLEKTLLEEAKLIKARLTRAKAKSGYFLTADVSQADFKQADLDQAALIDANVNQADFSGGSLKAALFYHSSGQKVNFAGADLENTRILGESDLPETNFESINAPKMSCMNSNLAGANFTNTNLQRAMIEDCDLTDASFKDARAQYARFHRSNLSGADLKKINLMFGSLRKVRLAQADLRNANLYNADTYKISLNQTRLEGANIKKTLLDKVKDHLPKNWKV